MKPDWRTLMWHMPGRTWQALLRAASITLWWRFGAAVIITAMVATLILIVWQGPWTSVVEVNRLNWLGWFGVLLIMALLFCVAGLFERNLTIEASRDGISLSAGGERNHTDEDEPAELPIEKRVPR